MHLIGMQDRKEKYPLGIPVCPKYRTERRNTRWVYLHVQNTGQKGERTWIKRQTNVSCLYLRACSL